MTVASTAGDGVHLGVVELRDSRGRADDGGDAAGRRPVRCRAGAGRRGRDGGNDRVEFRARRQDWTAGRRTVLEAELPAVGLVAGGAFGGRVERRSAFWRRRVLAMKFWPFGKRETRSGALGPQQIADRFIADASDPAATAFTQLAAAEACAGLVSRSLLMADVTAPSWATCCAVAGPAGDGRASPDSRWRSCRGHRPGQDGNAAPVAGCQLRRAFRHRRPCDRGDGG